jgi:hypothetical protein
MQLSPLEEDTGLALLQGRGESDETLSYKENSYAVTAAEVLGPRILHYIEELLGLGPGSDGDGDGNAAGADAPVSPCFFYHSQPRVPEPLVYAAELLCVLHGEKALVMVQYDTPTEAQHRHPLVRSLVRATVAAAHAEASAVDVAHTVLRYRQDTTLVLYRAKHEALVAALMPEGQAQALHPVPYPNYNGPPDSLLAEEHAQVYNSGWNGFVLGYPQPLVDAYCTDFHNSLTVAQKRAEGKRAKRDVQAHFQSRALSRSTELDESVPREALERLYEAVYKDTGSHGLDQWS